MSSVSINHELAFSINTILLTSTFNTNLDNYDTFTRSRQIIGLKIDMWFLVTESYF